VAVPHQAIAAVGKLQALHRREKHLGFHLDSLRKQLPFAPALKSLSTVSKTIEDSWGKQPVGHCEMSLTFCDRPP